MRYQIVKICQLCFANLAIKDAKREAFNFFAEDMLPNTPYSFEYRVARSESKIGDPYEVALYCTFDFNQVPQYEMQHVTLTPEDKFLKPIPGRPFKERLKNAWTYIRFGKYDQSYYKRVPKGEYEGGLK